MNRTAARDLRVGDQVEPLEVTTTNVQLFRFSAVTWNPHRIHYDLGYAQTEGYQDVVVQSHLHAAFLYRCLADWLGTDLEAHITRFGWRNRAIAVCGATLTCRGAVTRVDDEAGVISVDIALEELDQAGTTCATAWATVAVPDTETADGLVTIKAGIDD